MSAQIFIDKLEASNLLDDEVIGKLRRKISKPGKVPPAKAVANYCLEKGFLTESQATKILENVARDVERLRASSSQTLDVVQDDLGGTMLTADDLVGKNESASQAVQPVEPIVDLSANVSTTAPVEVVEQIADPFALNAGDGNPYDGGSATNGGLTEETEKKEAKKFEGKRKHEQSFESRWVIVGSFLLVFLLLAGWFFFVVLAKSSSDDVWREAEEKFSSESYPSAVEVYKSFIKNYKGDPNSPYAHVKYRVAEMKIAASGKDVENTIKVFKSNVDDITLLMADQIEDRPFEEEIRAMIAYDTVIAAQKTAKAAANKTTVKEKEEAVEKLKKMMELVDKGGFVPRSEKEKPAISSIIEATQATLHNVENAIVKENDTTLSILDIEDKIEAGQTDDAFDVFDDLVTKHPAAAADERVINVVQLISKKEKSLVTMLNPEVVKFEDVQVSESPSFINRVTIPTLTSGSVKGLQGEVAAVLASGSVYGVDISSGKMLWRHFVGYETVIQPVWLEDPKRVLLADQKNDRLMLVEPDTGKTVWHKDIGEDFLAPAISRSKIFLSMKSGKVARMDSETGKISAMVQLPQRLTVPVTPNNSGNILYQVGGHLNLYVLSVSLSDISCVQAFYVGHAQGAVRAPPVLLQDVLILPVNTTPMSCELKILVNEEDSMELTIGGPEVELKGMITKPMQIYGNYLVTMTPNGEMQVFEIDAREDEFELAKVAAESLNLPMDREVYMAVRDGKIWVGTKGIVQFSVIRTKQELKDQSVADNADFFVGEMIPYEELLVHVRRRAGSDMTSITGVNPVSLSEIWRLDLGGELAGPPLVNNDDVVAVNSQGDFFKLDASTIDAGVSHSPVYRASKTQQNLVFTRSVYFGDGSAFLMGPIDRKDSISFVPENTTLPLSLSELDVADLNVTSDPVRFRDGVLIGLSNGEVRHVKPRSIQDDAVFVPKSDVGVEFYWQRPCVLTPDTFAIANHDGRMFIVKYVADGETPYMVQMVESKSARRIIGPLVKNGDLIYALGDGPNGNDLLAFNAVDLKMKASFPLGGVSTWGPETLGKWTYATQADGTLVAFGTGPMPEFEIKLPDGRAVGRPLQWKEKTIVTLRDGKIAVFDANQPTDGAVIIDSHQPLSGQSSIAGNRLFVASTDGSIGVFDLSLVK